MRSLILATAALAAAAAVMPSRSEAASDGGFFVNGRIGRSDLSKGRLDDNDTGYAANIGYRWAVAPSFLIGIEGGYTDLGEFSVRTPLQKVTTSISGWNVGANGRFTIADRWYLTGRAGLFRGDTEVKAAPFRSDDNSNKWYAGIGFGYDFSNNLSVGLNYDYYKSSLDGANFNPKLVSVSGEYRF